MLIAIGLNSTIRFTACTGSPTSSERHSTVAIRWVFASIFTAVGILNWVLGLFGVTRAVADQPWGIRPRIAVMIIWRWWATRDHLLAGLQASPTSVHERPNRRGRAGARRFFRVTCRCSPVLLFSGADVGISGMQVFADRRCWWATGRPGGGRLTCPLLLQPAFYYNDSATARHRVGIFLVVVIFAILNWRLIQGRSAACGEVARDLDQRGRVITYLP